MAILDVDRIYTFSQFSEFNQPPEEILAELGYDLQIEGLDLLRAKVVDSTVLQKSLERRIQLTPLTSDKRGEKRWWLQFFLKL